MPARNPFLVLQLPPNATVEDIKAAWRRLARQHHPDLTSGDQALERRATRRMAEINAAYVELKDPVRRRLHSDAASRTSAAGRWSSPSATDAAYAPAAEPDIPGRHDSVPTPHNVRPVTARIDTSALYRPRNTTLHPTGRSPLPGLPPRPRSYVRREPPRASSPSGPALVRPGPSLDEELPPLEVALEMPISFGKFAGLTLGDVADLEPTYVDWMVRTISRDADLLLAARVVLRHLERSGELVRPPLDTIFRE